MAQYQYNHHEERGHFDAYVLDSNDNVVFEVHYPDFYEDEESGELIEGTTIFDDGFMKNPHDVEGLEKHLKSLGILKEDDELSVGYANGGMMEDGGETPKGRTLQKVKISIYDVDMGGDKVYSGDHWFDKEQLEKRTNNEVGAFILKKYFLDYGNYYTYKVTRTKEFKEIKENGGTIVRGIKTKLNKQDSVFALPIEVSVLVPSTKNASDKIGKAEFANRIEETQNYLSTLFGGFTSQDAEGGYTSEEKGLINEDVYEVTSFASAKDFKNKFETLVNQVKQWCKSWGQESIGLILEGDMFYIDKDIVYANGGLINQNKQMVLSQIKEIKHHANEVKDAIDKQEDVEAWVVGKMERSATDLSDVTHYLDGKSEYAKGGNVEVDFNPVLIYHEKQGNFIIPKNLVYAWLYDDKDAGEKLEKQEYMYPMFPYASYSFRGTPPLLQLWTKKYQQKIIGSNRLIGIIKGFYIPEENKLYIEMQTTRKDMRRKGVMSYMIKALRKEFNLEKEDVVFEDLTPMGKKFVKGNNYEDGGYMAKGGNIPTIERKVEEVNRLIKLGNDNDIEVVDNSSTWQSPMKYKTIKYSNGVLYVEYRELDLYSYLKGRGEKYEVKKEKTTKNDDSYGFGAGVTQRYVLNDIAKMYRKALKVNGITYEDGGEMDDMQSAKSSARTNIDYDDVVNDAIEYAGSEWLTMTKSQKDELISNMYEQRKQHISSFANGGKIDLSEYENIETLIDLYKVKSKWFALGKKYNHEATGSGYTKREALEDLENHLSYATTSDEYANGGKIDSEEEYDPENDLFNNVESLPQEVQDVLEMHEEDWDYTYENCSNLQNDLEEVGYTIDWYLDAQPYNLRKMEDGGIMASGGDINDLFPNYEIVENDGNTEVRKGNFTFYFNGLGESAKLVEIYHRPTDMLCERDEAYKIQLGTIDSSLSSKYLFSFTHPTMGSFQLRGKFNILKERPTFVDGSTYAKGGMATFQDKVDAISDRLEGEKVPKRLEKDYGKTYNKEESIEAAQRIAGAMRKKYKN